MYASKLELQSTVHGLPSRWYRRRYILPRALIICTKKVQSDLNRAYLQLGSTWTNKIKMCTCIDRAVAPITRLSAKFHWIFGWLHSDRKTLPLRDTRRKFSFCLMYHFANRQRKWTKNSTTMLLETHWTKISISWNVVLSISRQNSVAQAFRGNPSPVYQENGEINDFM